MYSETVLPELIEKFIHEIVQNGVPVCDEEPVIDRGFIATGSSFAIDHHPLVAEPSEIGSLNTRSP